MSRDVVLDPSLLVRAATEPAGRPAIEAWREGRIRPVLTRRMLAHALGLLRDAGLPYVLLERWALWLSDAQKVRMLEDGTEGQPILAEYVEAARKASAPILTDRPEDFEGTGVSLEKPSAA